MLENKEKCQDLVQQATKFKRRDGNITHQRKSKSSFSINTYLELTLLMEEGK